MNAIRLLLTGWLRRRRLGLLLTGLSAFLSFFAFLGLRVAHDTLLHRAGTFLSRSGTPDLILTFENASRETADAALLETDGVAAVSYGLRCVTQGRCADGQIRTVRLLALEDDGLLRPVTDAEPADPDTCFLSAGYAHDFGQALLSGLTLPDGFTPKIGGICYLPVYAAVYIDAFSACTDGDVVDLLAPFEVLFRYVPGSDRNYAFVSAAPDADIDLLMQSIRKVRGLKLLSVERFSDDPAFSESRRLLGSVLPVCRLFSVLLFTVGFLFICIFLSGVAGRSRDTVAVLRADGASFGQLYAAFFLASTGSLLAGLLPAVFASLPLARAIADVTAGNAGLPASKLCVSPLLLLHTLALCILAALVSALICLLIASRGSILEEKRRSAKARGARLRDLAVSFVCACVAGILVLSTGAFRDSIAAVRAERFDVRERYDAEVVYDGPAALTALDALSAVPGTERVEPVFAYPAELTYGVARRRVMVLGVSQDAALLRFETEAGDPVEPIPNMVILASATADALGTGPQAVISGTVGYKGKRLESECQVAGTALQHSAFCELVSLDTITEYLDSSGVMNIALVRFSGSDPETAAAFVRTVKALPQVYTVQLREGAIARFDRRYAGMRALTDWIVLDGTVLGASAFLLLGYGAWRKNRRRSAILLLLGDSVVSVTLRDLRTALCGAVLGFLAACILSVPLERAIVTRLSTDAVVYPLTVRPATVLSAAALVLSAALVTAVLYAILTVRRSKDYI